MINNSAAGLCLLLLILMCGCYFGDEAAVRSVLSETYLAAQRGDIEFALQRLTPDSETSRLFLNLKEDSEAKYSAALADSGSMMRDLLKDKKLKVISVKINNDTAAIECVILGENTEAKSQVTAKKMNGKWLLKELPTLPLL